jgi:NADPH:quinone reductase-like Zn-dependent oxidoreductase
MKAIRIHDYGEADALVYEDAPIPEPPPDGVLIKVHAAGVNPVDWKIRKGLMRAMRPLQFPAIMGSDIAGTIALAGPLVTRLKEGDRVIARVDGAYAEFAAAKTDAVAPAPSSIPLAHAAGIPIAAGTAWTVLFDAANVRAGQKVLIQGGSGGVGIFAVQLAKLAGAHVVATTSGPNVAMVKSLGADEVVDYRAVDVASNVKDVDLVVDCVGGETLKRSFGLLRKGGLLITIVAPPDEALAKQHGVTARFERGNMNGIRLQEISGLIDAGKLKVVIEKELPLAEAKAAHQLSESGRARGKIILRVQ